MYWLLLIVGLALAAAPWRYPERRPASDAQLKYLRSLAAARRIDLNRELRLRWQVAVDDLDSGSAGSLIEMLKAGESVVPLYRTRRG